MCVHPGERHHRLTGACHAGQHGRAIPLWAGELIWVLLIAVQQVSCHRQALPDPGNVRAGRSDDSGQFPVRIARLWGRAPSHSFPQPAQRGRWHQITQRRGREHHAKIAHLPRGSDGADASLAMPTERLKVIDGQVLWFRWRPRPLGQEPDQPCQNLPADLAEASVRSAPAGPMRAAQLAASAGCQPGSGNDETWKRQERPSSPVNSTTVPCVDPWMAGGGS